MLIPSKVFLFYYSILFDLIVGVGNEEDYIIISLVRSKEIGFLKSLRRTNVMLTRFKRGMFVVTSKKFLDGPGRDCLVGDIAQQVGSGAWLSVEDIAESKFFGPKKTPK
ncbi:hypothetical protein P691DRAFT_294448 [Macrolepiota fuliginosa MF-IS2]|uniref:DNA2/NAM7 helicase-like C-terminal domain-containing protein n=1 Tax=Macrolepiota fuliginosa MF-IS2 TaxID=1400762 RepID=A0A9P5XLG9_9AGAR|nr:hypothetical protein P691DRAFT_294448 [Macrolepiota fuliginosa MF-IS2]